MLARSGIYHENLMVTGKHITILGMTGPKGTVIDGGGKGPAVTITNSNALLAGVTVTNGNGGGVVISGTGLVEITNSIVGENLEGGIVCSQGSSVTITNSVIHSNEGGGIYCFNRTQLAIHNTVISGNLGAGGISCVLCDNLSVTYSTISGNRSSGIFLVDSPNSNLMGSILWFNGEYPYPVNASSWNDIIHEIVAIRSPIPVMLMSALTLYMTPQPWLECPPWCGNKLTWSLRFQDQGNIGIQGIPVPFVNPAYFWVAPTTGGNYELSGLVGIDMTGDPFVETIVCDDTDLRGVPRRLDGNDDGIASCDVGAYEFGAFRITTDTDWRAIGPVGNLEGRSLDTVGREWENRNVGWNSDLTFDDSAAAGWKNAIFNQTAHPPRPEIAFVWVDDPEHDGKKGATPAYFRYVFDLAEVPKFAELTVLADDDAQVYLNGQLVVNDLDGTVTLSPNIDVTRYLQAGKNLIAVKAHDSFGVFEGLYLLLRGGLPELVNDAVNFEIIQRFPTDKLDTEGCPAGYQGKFHFIARLTNTLATNLWGLQLEIAELTNGNLLLSDDGLSLGGTGRRGRRITKRRLHWRGASPRRIR